MSKRKTAVADSGLQDRGFGFLVNDVARLMKTAIDYRGEKLGLTRAQWRLLVILHRRQGMTQSELATLLELKVPTVGRLVHKMSERGWIRIEADNSDRRQKRLYLSKTVLPLMNRVRDHIDTLREDALSGLSEAETEHLMDMLHRIKGNLQTIVGETPRPEDR
jgi:DNA-binding MarR family transcriptional regulator